VSTSGAPESTGGVVVVEVGDVVPVEVGTLGAVSVDVGAPVRRPPPS